MRKLDKSMNSFFKKTPSGQEVFYPWGYFGKGFIVPDEAKKLALQASFKKIQLLSMIFLFTFFMLGQSLKAPVFIGVLCLYLIAFFFAVKRVTQGMERATEKMSVTQFYSKHLEDLSYLGLTVLSLCSLLFVVPGVWMLSQGREFWLSIGSIIFFGLALSIFLFGFFQKIKKNRRS